MSGGDVRALFREIGVALTTRATREASVRCFADPEAHRNGDRRRSCSVNIASGAWFCHACGAKGGPYDAALALGKSPAEAMALLEEHGFVESDRQRDRSAKAQKSKKKPFQAPSKEQLAVWNEALTHNPKLLGRLLDLRRWTPEAIRKLQVGFDGKRVVFPIHSAQGELVGLVRYLPNPATRGGRLKSDADDGSCRELFPAPETLNSDRIFLIEGEPDSVTAHSLGLPAVAVPGTGNWKGKYAKRFMGKRVVLLPDCDEPGRRLAKKVAADLVGVAAEVKILDLDSKRDDKYDLTDLALEAKPDEQDEVRRIIEQMAEAAPVFEPVTAEVADGGGTLSIPPDMTATLHTPPQIAHEKAILGVLQGVLDRLGLVGERNAAQLVYLAVTSRLLESPISPVLKGPSAGGKSHIVAQVLRFFPESAYYALTGMSERSLAYSTEPLEHRMLVIYEAAGLAHDFATALLRSLLSEGHIRYETVDRTKEGLRGRLLERPGPTGAILTTTQVKLEPELETRLLSIPVTDTQEQTKAILLAQADDDDDDDLDLSPWIELQLWLETGPCLVTVPFARELAKRIEPVAVRLRRDWPTVLGLVKAHALLHRASREVDKSERIVATLDDYAVVRELVADLIAQGAGATVNSTVRGTVEAVAGLATSYEHGVPQSALAKELKLDRSSVSRRVRACLSDAYLENLEERHGRPYRLKIGGPLPDDVSILPEPDALRPCSAVGGVLHGAETDESRATSGVAGDCCTVARDSRGEERGLQESPIIPEKSPTGEVEKEPNRTMSDLTYSRGKWRGTL